MARKLLGCSVEQFFNFFWMSVFFPVSIEQRGQVAGPMRFARHSRALLAGIQRLFRRAVTKPERRGVTRQSRIFQAVRKKPGIAPVESARVANARRKFAAAAPGAAQTSAQRARAGHIDRQMGCIDVECSF
jgi:hypothetical protein